MGGGSLKESTVFTIFVCFPTVFITVFNGFRNFHTFCGILKRLLFLLAPSGGPGDGSCAVRSSPLPLRGKRVGWGIVRGAL